ncbi:preprotein translocase subunit YajC [Cytobacillus eiseniae]|uniref:Preprotein translocase subunit YajC n=1 Tax=Cytobacillus eiseniae TaxID=762947 RepID=A0ABS4RC64_9BACI|nr:hypothetical protein [Cytobacillus eiseniae]MBP2240485.1 preprotein translocase subunit YajC [Cytobacillus eiseniae]
MLEWTVLSLFLYFPEDKTEYIPAGIALAIFALAAFFTFKFFIKISKKEEAKAKELEKSLKKGENS